MRAKPSEIFINFALTFLLLSGGGALLRSAQRGEPAGVNFSALDHIETLDSRVLSVEHNQQDIKDRLARLEVQAEIMMNLGKLIFGIIAAMMLRDLGKAVMSSKIALAKKFTGE